MRLRVRVRTGLLLVGGMAVLLLYSFVDGPSLRPAVPARRLQIVRITADDIAKMAGNIGPSDPIILVSLHPPPPSPQTLLTATLPPRSPPEQPPFLLAPRALQHPDTQSNLQYDASDAVPTSKPRHDVTVSNVSRQVTQSTADDSKQNVSGFYAKEMELVAMAPFKSISIDKRKKLIMYLNHLGKGRFNEIYKSVVGGETTDTRSGIHDAKLTRAAAERPRVTEAPPLAASSTRSKDRNILAPPRYFNENQKGYAARVVVESVTLPSGWSSSPRVDQTLSARRDHVREVCHKYNLHEPSPSNSINAWEFLINPRHKLVWCSIFKAASSTWFYNFNVLAGYSENRLLRAKETPITLARRKYPRPTVSELVNFMNQTERPLSFMIARHPLHRLVSGYRDKLLSGRRYYSNLSRRIVQSYPQLGDNTMVETAVSNPHDIRGNPNSLLSKALSKVKLARMILVPTFPQFVQYIIDSNRKGDILDEHWAPMYKFCSPCLFEFDVFAKMETLDEDGNYIIFKSGIEKIVKPKRINRNKNAPTDKVAHSFLCQLSRPMMLDLINMYRIDIELFDYEFEQYINCTTEQVRLEKVR